MLISSLRCRITYDKSKQTINSTNEDHYQKVTAFNRSTPSLISIGSTNSQLSVLTYPALEEVFPSIEYEGEEIFDTDFDDSGEMVRCGGAAVASLSGV